MLEKKSDYEQKENVFQYLASQDKSLVEELNAHNDPAQFAYDKALEYEEAQREKLRAELQKEFENTDHSKDVKDEDSASAKAPDLINATESGKDNQNVKSTETLADVFDD